MQPKNAILLKVEPIGIYYSLFAKLISKSLLNSLNTPE